MALLNWMRPLVAAAVIGSAAAANQSGDPVEGEAVYKTCKSCHQIGDGARHRVGPHLNGVFGRVAASHDDFRYSKALEQVRIDGLKWQADTLDAFLENPKAFAKGTRMSFRGLKDAGDRLNVIAYLQSFSEGPADSTQTATAELDLDPAILALEGDAEYGEYLSSECTTCHKADGGDDGIPSIVLWPEEDFVVAMHAYKNKVRPNPVMQMMAGRLDAEEIAALAAYFAKIE